MPNTGVEAYAVCNEHLYVAMRTLIPKTNTDGIYRVVRYDGDSEAHKCVCKRPADWFFSKITTVSQKTLDKHGIRVTRV